MIRLASDQAISPFLSAAESWSILLGLITPFLVSVVNQPKWTSQQKRVLSIIVAVIVGIVNLLVQGAFTNLNQVTWAGVISVVVLVVGSSQAAYALLWKPTGAADSVERATSKTEQDKAA